MAGKAQTGKTAPGKKTSGKKGVQPTADGATEVHVNLGPRSYDIHIGRGNLAQCGAFLTARQPTTQVVVLTDLHIEPHWSEAVVASLTAAGCAVDLLVIEPGEAMKSVDSVGWLWERFAELGVDRKTVVVALGGGVLGDLAGFVAASYLRGLRFMQIPTTLLAMVDSSVGGKTGVNLPTGKNLVGAFWQPVAVCIDTQTLATLPEREFLAGLAEVIKYGVILDAEFFVYLEQNVELILSRDPLVLQTIIARCCRLKADVVEQDEREETGVRAVLNYGHTFAHAFENLTGYGKLLHGEAVAIGMHCAARLACLLGRVDQAFVDRQQKLLTALRLPWKSPVLAPRAVMDVMARDKKVSHGKLKFVLPSQLGQVELVGEVTPEQVTLILNTKT